MGAKAPLLTYFGKPKQTDAIKKVLEKNLVRIQLTGLIGSSFAITASSVVRDSNTPHLFIFRDKEEASYFMNDLESLLKNEVFFFRGLPLVIGTFAEILAGSAFARTIRNAYPCFGRPFFETNFASA